MARRHLGKKDAKGIAAERIEVLFEMAGTEAKAGKHDRARRYVALALRIGERHKVRPGHKREYCPSCHAYFVPALNARSRTGSGHVIITCLDCGNILRFPLGEKRR
jgi:ribonuclease P protein subunit RPR2